MSDKVVLEGKIAVNVLVDVLATKTSADHFPILHELHKVFTDHYDLSQFVNRIITFPVDEGVLVKADRIDNRQLKPFNDLPGLL